MAKREMIVTGYTGDRAEEQVDPFLRHLIGKFTDELNEADKALYDYTAIAGLPDFYWASYDTETFSLEGSDSSNPGIKVTMGFAPRNELDYKRLRLMLNAAITIANTLDEEL